MIFCFFGVAHSLKNFAEFGVNGAQFSDYFPIFGRIHQKLFGNRLSFLIIFERGGGVARVRIVVRCAHDVAEPEISVNQIFLERRIALCVLCKPVEINGGIL